MSYLHLLSGSDIRGEAVAVPGAEPTLTEETARRIGYAFAGWLAQKLGMPARGLAVAVGRDSRVSGPALAAAALQGIAAAGARALDCGLCTTPAMFMTTLPNGLGCQGAVMVTASHHPWTRNGLKFFTAQGGLGGGDVGALLARAEAAQAPPVSGEPAEPAPFLPAYAAMLKDLVRVRLNTARERPLEGLRVAVDAGNGAGGFYARMLEELGADTAGSRYLEPDGRFPNHIPNPENEGAMAAICEAVRQSGADLGVIFDTDCDRAAVVDAGGEAINRNRLIALTAAMLLAEHPGATVVTDSTTSAGLSRFIRARGGVHHRFKRGYRNVIDEAVRLNARGVDCPLAMETSGHCAMRNNYFLDDGMYLSTLLVAEAMRRKASGGRLSDLIAGLREPAEELELRLSITAPGFAQAGRRALERLAEAAASWPDCRRAPDDREGIRLLFGPEGGAESAWLMMRLSVHDPVLPVNVESDLPGWIPALLARLHEALDGCEGVDLAPLM
ncbi:MAG: phosphomannomutase/phosphoglucomutase [Clostridia bacterium]|nr:phosphomannomutase/phosphoglucomutase [Clostridia bacterium]